MGPDQARDSEALLSLRVSDEVLHPDHGFPVRVIGPTRPGVHRTEWVGRIDVL